MIAGEHSLRDVGSDAPPVMLAALRQHLLSILRVAVSYAPRPLDPPPQEGALANPGMAYASRTPLTCNDLINSLEVRNLESGGYAWLS